MPRARAREGPPYESSTSAEEGVMSSNKDQQLTKRLSTAASARRAMRPKLDAFKLDLDQREAALNRRDLSDAELQGLRQGIDPIAESLRALYRRSRAEA